MTPALLPRPLGGLAALATATALMLAACASSAPTDQAPAPNAASTTTAASETLAPNSNLHVEGIPAVPLSVVKAVDKYTDFRGHGFVDWHPAQREMLVTHRPAGGSTAQLYRVSAPLAEPERLTDFADPVYSASYEPLDGKYIVFERSSGGNEVNQLYRMELGTRATTLLTDPDQRHNVETWLHEKRGVASRLLYTSVPLDRTAAGGARAQISTTLWLMDPLKPEARRKVIELPGGGWNASSVSWDNKQAALTNYISANESQVWLLDLASGKRRQLLPAPGSKQRATHLASGFSRDNKALFFVSDRIGEFNELQRVNLANGAITRVTGHISWDVAGGSLSDDGRLLALNINEDGQGKLRLVDARSLKEKPAPALPAGNLSGMHFHPKRGELAFGLNSSAGPSQIYSLDPASGQVQQWTRAYAPEGVDPTRFAPQQLVRWKSFDGRTISGMLTMPPAGFSGKRPVMINIHGGPEAQAQFGFLNRNNYFVEEMGIAIIQPNVRGSTGYGKTFVALDNGLQREDSVKDIGALIDWIATQPNLDASRIVVIGGSYGGYMSLAVSTNYADRIAGAIDIVGISHFVTFLNNTESYRRDLRRVEYGDERDPAMKAFLDKISPLTNAARIKKPLFVIQGRNDPRVPYTEAEQIVKSARANGTPVWYLRAENEGHGFQRKENADYQFYATVLFLRDTLKLQ
ncbi:MAG TPA: prolyl oligopeptidase family serine peptidase [Ideonella sp.]|uniref:S9 family peptidase n=1 Tax=Ideonella sp. TaxID=1929293 RepID=UPI002E376D8F|nr:prolyl oligopeptidase family serine peptidase [Ideonella sp.]HEX5685588.1 prolyl oligopeptidase family serine peptidase [Ideonella sp.]